MSSRRRAVAGHRGSWSNGAGGTGHGGRRHGGLSGGGSDFTGGAQGWIGSDLSCAPGSGLELTCTTTTEHSATEGNPAGSIDSRLDVIVNGGGVLEGQTTWTSPDFAIPTGSPTGSAAVALDRRLDVEGLVALDPQSSYVVRLIDRSDADRATEVLGDTLDDTDATFTRRPSPCPPGRS